MMSFYMPVPLRELALAVSELPALPTRTVPPAVIRCPNVEGRRGEWVRTSSSSDRAAPDGFPPPPNARGLLPNDGDGREHPARGPPLTPAPTAATRPAEP